MIARAITSPGLSSRVMARLATTKNNPSVVTTSSLLRSFSDYYNNNNDNDPDRRRTALVLGSSGATGSAIARHLAKKGMKVLGADVMELPNDFTGDWELNDFIALPRQATVSDLTVRLVRGVEFYLQNCKDDDCDGLDAIICATGGWQGDPPVATATTTTTTTTTTTGAAEPTEQEMEHAAIEYAETVQNMMRMNLDPVVAASFVAQHYMAPEGLMVVIGATAALGPTPGMLGYGLSKTAAHQLVHTLGASTGKSIGTKSERKVGRRVRRNLQALDDMTVLGILPTTIDTPSNRKAMPEGNVEQWTKPKDIAKEIAMWIDKPPLRPHSGSLVKVRAQRDGSGAVFELVR